MFQLPFLLWQNYFNPRSLRKASTLLKSIIKNFMKISIHEAYARLRRYAHCTFLELFQISIHEAYARLRLFEWENLPETCDISIHEAYARLRLLSGCSIDNFSLFQSTKPTQGFDTDPFQTSAYQNNISIHEAYARLRPLTHITGRLELHFNPRSLRKASTANEHNYHSLCALPIVQYYHIRKRSSIHIPLFHPFVVKYTHLIRCESPWEIMFTCGSHRRFLPLYCKSFIFYIPASLSPCCKKK